MYVVYNHEFLSYSDGELQSSGAVLKLLHNGSPIAEVSCATVTLIHQRVMTTEYGGEYQCSAYQPDSTTPQEESDIRELQVLSESN